MPTQTYAHRFQDGDHAEIEIGSTGIEAADAFVEDYEPNAVQGILFALVLSVPLWVAGLMAYWSM